MGVWGVGEAEARHCYAARHPCVAPGSFLSIWIYRWRVREKTTERLRAREREREGQGGECCCCCCHHCCMTGRLKRGDTSVTVLTFCSPGATSQCSAPVFFTCTLTMSEGTQQPTIVGWRTPVACVHSPRLGYLHSSHTFKGAQLFYGTQSNPKRCNFSYRFIRGAITYGLDIHLLCFHRILSKSPALYILW